MDVLPNEILKIIIGFFDKDDLLAVRLLNKTWQIYAEDQLRFKYFSLKKDEDIINLIRITSWRNLNNTHSTPFNRFELHKKLYDNNIFEKLSNVYGNMIEGLIFNTNFLFLQKPSLKNMFQLLMNTPNLEEAYFRYQNRSDSPINEYKLHLPNLRFIEFVQTDTGLIQLILNAAPNIHEVKMEIGRGTSENWKDCVNIFQSMATRGIELKLKIIIAIYGIVLHHFKELTEIPIKVTDLSLWISKDDFDMTDLSPIQDFIQKHSKELKRLNIECTMKFFEEKPWTLDLKNMYNLENLELSGGEVNGVKRRFEVNLELAPLLKKLNIKLGTKLTFGPVPLLKSLTIQLESDTACEYLNILRIRLIEENVRLQKLNLIYSYCFVVILKKEDLIARYQQLNSFLGSQANNLCELNFSARFLPNMENFQFPKMVNLRKLKLKLQHEENEVKKIRLQHSQFPHLEFLRLGTSLYPNPCSIETLENVRTLILDSGSCFDFDKAGLRFPKLKKLDIINMQHKKTGARLLPFIFKNMTNVEELYIEDGFSWKGFTGISEIVNFLGKAANKSNNLKTSVSNLGDMNALQNLKLGGCIELDDLKAVSYLISCGKLSNLKYFEVTMGRKDQELITPFFEIIEANNTKTKIYFKD